MNAKEIEACAQAAERWPKGFDGGSLFSDPDIEEAYCDSVGRDEMPEDGDSCC